MSWVMSDLNIVQITPLLSRGLTSALCTLVQYMCTVRSSLRVPRDSTLTLSDSGDFGHHEQLFWPVQGRRQEESTEECQESLCSGRESPWSPEKVRWRRTKPRRQSSRSTPSHMYRAARDGGSQGEIEWRVLYEPPVSLSSLTSFL